jgi:hypothetical protein
MRWQVRGQRALASALASVLASPWANALARSLASSLANAPNALEVIENNVLSDMATRLTELLAA